MLFRFYKMSLKRLWPFCFWVWVGLSGMGKAAHAQGLYVPEEPRFNHLGVEDGLSQSIVSSILKDRDGFLWFGTRDGLNRWDGYSFRIYQNSPFDSTTVIGAGIDRLLLDEQGRLWAASVQGYSRYDPKTNKFRQFRSSVPTSMRTGVIRQGKHFLNASIANEIISFNTETGVFKKGKPLGYGTLTMLAHQGRIYAGGVGVLCLVNMNDLSCSPLLKMVSHLSFLALTPKDENSFWGFVSSADKKAPTQLLQISLAGKIIRTITLGLRLPVPYQMRQVEEVLFIPTNFGLFVVDLNSGKLIRSIFKTNKKDGLGNHDILSLYHDEQQSLWLGTFGGVYRTRLHKPRFEWYQHRPQDARSLSSSDINGMGESRDGRIWIGTANGVNLFDPVTKTFERYVQPIHDLNNSINKVWNILEARDGTVWLGTKADCLQRLDRKTRRFVRDKRLNCFGSGIRALKESRDGNLLIGTSVGFTIFNPKTGEVKRIGYGDPKAHSLTDGRVNAIYEAPNGTLWIGTDVGLNRLDLNKPHIQHFKQNIRDTLSLSNNNIWNILPDKKNPDVLWIGTIGGGINRFDTKTNKSTHILAKDGLPSNVIYGLLSAKDGRLWVSTAAGVSHFDPYRFPYRFVNYREKDGLQGLEYNLMSHFTARDGTLYFGGPNGLNRFNTHDIRQTLSSAPIVISRFNKGNIQLPSIYKGGEKIVLQPHENNFSIEFATLNYADPIKNQYRYRLVGFDSNWVSLLQNRRPSAHYTNVPPGTYTFEVQGASGDGRFDVNKTLAVQIVVEAFYWQTWWFRAIFAMLAVLLLASMNYGYRRYKQREDARIEAEEREIKRRLAESRERERLRIAQELHDGPMQQLYTIGHQLDDLLEVAPQTQAIRASLNKTASELREVVGELRPAMLRLLGIKPALNALIRQFERRNTKVNITTDLVADGKQWPEEIQHTLYRILQEALSNVQKHAQATEVHIALLEYPEKVKLTIQDNGIGFLVPEKLVNLARTSRYGLLGCVERAEILNGTVQIIASPERGTTVLVEIPFDTLPEKPKKHPK